MTIDRLIGKNDIDCHPIGVGRLWNRCQVAPDIGFEFQTAREAWNGYGVAIPRRAAPEFCEERFALLGKRARGTPDARCVRSLVCEGGKHTS